ncbi:MAG TPA: gephyrin-like molybdotransferase Glp [Solirubrobacterales bacterium]|nr:gephyrin-like molybdotransferase Glp [Solirubrobacterales bacterium]
MSTAIGVDEARREILARVRPTSAQEVRLGEALGRRLAVDAVADGQFQPFDNSAMDGFAVRAAEVADAGPGSPVALVVIDESRAGHPATHAVKPGEAIAISTGAVLPAGADAVVRVEDTEVDGPTADRPDRGTVFVRAAVARDENVRRAGEDIAVGETVLAAGTELGPAELGALATIGLDPVAVHRRPRVAVVTSGDELVPAGMPLRPGQIHDSNSQTVPALVQLAGGEVVATRHAPDNPQGTRAALIRALEADVTIICGGVSVGEHDHVKAALDDLGAEQVFWRVALKPGGPTWFGTRNETLVFGLPGNPVSVMATFLLFVRPALLAMAVGEPTGRRLTARLGAGYEKPTDRAHAARCRLELDERGWVATPLPRQGSHVLSSMVGADGLALIPTEAAAMAAGDAVEVELLDRASMGR